MKGYIIGLSYKKALEAVKLINEWAKKNGVPDEVDANASTGGVHVTTKTELQILELNVVMDENNLDHIRHEMPYRLKNAEEKTVILKKEGIG